MKCRTSGEIAIGHLQITYGVSHEISLLFKLKYYIFWEFPGGPVVRTPRFQCRRQGFSGQGTKIPHAAQRGPPKKKKLKYI